MPIDVPILGNNKVKLTPEGGIAISVINKTGGVSAKGMIVEPASSTDNAVKLTTDGDVDPIGIIYEAGIADGEEMFIVVAGIAEVYYGVAVTRATFSRVPIVADGLNPGEAMNEALPSPPFATDKHFQEIGHPIESRGTPGLAKTVLHFN
jgi:hypothetical protein